MNFHLVAHLPEYNPAMNFHLVAHLPEYNPAMNFHIVAHLPGRLLGAENNGYLSHYYIFISYRITISASSCYKVKQWLLQFNTFII